MKLSMKWLADYTDVSDIDTKAYCDRMTDTGSKVEGYEILGADIENVVVGKIRSIAPHENSDHLQICQLDCGTGEDIQIVTGAQNVFEGAVVPVAMVPAKLPGGIVIKAGKLRGVPSNGMLCSIGELGLTTHDMPGAIEDGILILNDVGLADAPIGADIHDVLGLTDTVVEFEITSNRPDCLSMIGLARESAVSFERPWTLPIPKKPAGADGDEIGKYLSVEVKEPSLCYRYSARVVKNVKIAPSPLWLRMRLRAAGVRPINNIVDITNYVMLEYGQPMHAFDYACLDGSRIIVRRAAAGEQFISLDDKPHTLDDSMLVIADEKKPVALAGVMGGQNSEITDSTTTVVFESAMFNGPSVRVSGKKLGMRTESSARFEKGLDRENTMPALDRACELVEMLGAGEIVDGTIDQYPAPAEPYKMKLESEKINRFLGLDLTQEAMADILRSLDFVVDGDEITVPSFRDDVRCMNDVAEEVLRIYGYTRIESTPLTGVTTQGGRTPRQLYAELIRDALVGMGVSQAETFSFISPKFYDKIRMSADDPRRKSVVISNPLGEDTSVMRTTVIPSMLTVLENNAAVKNRDAALFELGTAYLPVDGQDLPNEEKRVAIGFYLNDVKDASGFYKMKGIIDALLSVSNIYGAEYALYSEDNAFHPGRCAVVSAGGRKLGVFGEIHPLTLANYNIGAVTYVAELDFEALFDARVKLTEYTPLPKYPALERDFSFVCDEEVTVAALESCMKNAGGANFESVKLFDIYRGPQIGEGKKSVSFAVMLRAADRTLTDEEADGAVKKILKRLEAECGAVLRS
ncbi:MAG: phenylalanine--tRNA ligase subunit beta [Ruminococcaceae bacterium]|nr:phenylalanine--tRNA ligase subunit beta [Oscillospiraceae bacterium]